jgi:Gluconate 2-dehydrogenase subunit 3
MQKTAESQRVAVSRRAALRAIGTGIGTVAALPWLSDEGLLAFARIQETNGASQLKVLSRPQFETLEALVEAIIPTDDRSPGAKQARVADYIDLLLSESDAQTQGEWATGVAALDEESTRRFQAKFDRLAPAQAAALVTEISRNESAPSTILEQFFVKTKDAAIRGYYTSEIGIHKELAYKGNKFLREFVGCTHPEHGYSGGETQGR